VIGTVPIKVANTDPTKYHREVGILIVDSNRRVLLQQRALTKSHHPGFWTITAAGHIPTGMTPEEAAHMELTEEPGFDVQLAFVGKTFNQIPTQSRFFYNYVGQLDDPVLTLQRSEVAQADFYAEPEAIALLERQGGSASLPFVQRYFAGELDRFLP